MAIATDRDEKRLLELVAAYPLLSLPGLAALAGLPLTATERRLVRLRRCRVIDVETGHEDASGIERYVLALPGLRLLAARALVPTRRFGRLSPAIGAEPGRLPRHREHLLGVHRTLVRFATDAEFQNGRLLRCANEAGSTRRFRHGDRHAWVRPDGSGVVEADGNAIPFLLEYDRGTLDAGDLGAKLSGYRAYYAAGVWRDDFTRAPLLLFVCTDGRAERRVHAVALDFPELPILLTTEQRCARRLGNPSGLFGPVWQAASRAAREFSRREPGASREVGESVSLVSFVSLIPYSAGSGGRTR